MRREDCKWMRLELDEWHFLLGLGNWRMGNLGKGEVGGKLRNPQGKL